MINSYRRKRYFESSRGFHPPRKYLKPNISPSKMNAVSVPFEEISNECLFFLTIGKFDFRTTNRMKVAFSFIALASGEAVLDKLDNIYTIHPGSWEICFSINTTISSLFKMQSSIFHGLKLLLQRSKNVLF